MPAAPREPASQPQGRGAAAARRLLPSEERTAEGAGRGRGSAGSEPRAEGGRAGGRAGAAGTAVVRCLRRGSRGCLWTTPGELGGTAP